MFTRIFTVELGTGMREEGTAFAERWTAAASTLPDFVDVTFFGDEDLGVYGFFSLWKSREAAENAGQAVGPQVLEALVQAALKPPVVRIFDVYRPKPLRD